MQTQAANGTVLYKESYAYDSLGRPSATTRTIPDAEVPSPVPSTPLAATAYTVTLRYDSASRLEETVYPTGFTTRNFYNAFGALKEVRRSDGGRNDVFWMALSDPENSPSIGVSRFLLGNGVTTERTTSKVSGRVRVIDSGVRGGFGLQQIAYNYDVVANVRERDDAAAGLDESASHDALTAWPASPPSSEETPRSWTSTTRPTETSSPSRMSAATPMVVRVRMPSRQLRLHLSTTSMTLTAG
ncbi:MAG: hypothetical protein ACREIA_00210 [Opitutaceae bacterium]